MGPEIFFSILISISPPKVLQNYRPHSDPAVFKNGCGVCHRGHGKSGTPMLKYEEEELCYLCHSDKKTKTARELKINVSIDAPDVEKSFRKIFRHPVELKGIHTKGEMYPSSKKTGRHAECVDCHEPHTMISNKDVPPGQKKRNPYNGKGYEYELCFRCHGTASDLNPGEKDKRIQFESSRSFHPVIYPSFSSPIPSLKSPYFHGSFVNCSDCHGDDSSDAQGVHGSSYRYILKYNYTLEDGFDESEFTYALCYQCHLRSSIIRDESFRYHNLHILKNRISCNSCHDPHGSEYPSLISFKDFPSMKIQPASTGRFGYFKRGPGTGECFLTCHTPDGKKIEHNPAVY